MSLGKRVDFLAGVSLLILLALSVRLYALSVVRHSELRRGAEERRLRSDILEARRSPILDRNGVPLAIDRAVHDVVLDLPSFDPALNLVTPLAYCLRVTRGQALALVRRLRHDASREADATGGETVTVARVSLEESQRVHRILRRQAHLWPRVEWDGIHIVTHVATLQARARTLCRLAELTGSQPTRVAACVAEAVDTIHAVERRVDRVPLWQKPLPLIENAPTDVVLRVMELGFELPGVRVTRRYERFYPRGELASHVIGFLAAPTPEEARRDREARLLLDGERGLLGVLHGERETLDSSVRLRQELYGRRGAEWTYDDELRGTPGVVVTERDVKNNQRGERTTIQPCEGIPVRLTLDAELQAAAEAALDRAVTLHGDATAGGALVVMDLSDGGLLAVASSPRFDANEKSSRGYYAALRADGRNPLLHRAVQPYPPASTLKVLSAFAIFDAESEAAVAPGWTTDCQTFFSSTERTRFKCDGYHGRTGLVKSLSHSCNLFYFRAADRVGMAPLTDWVRRLGLHEPTAFGLAGERSGVFPYEGFKADRARDMGRSVGKWVRRLADAMQNPSDVETLDHARKMTSRAAGWYERFLADQTTYPGEVRNTIIGQGVVRLTPLHVTLIAAMVATGGRVPLPKLELAAETRYRDVALDPTVLAQVRLGMGRVVSEGTASSASIGLRRLDLAGKTGTGQQGKHQPYLGWFMGYYPASAPEIAFAVLVDRTRGHGGSVCGPVARAVLEAYEASRGGKLR